MTNVAKLLEHKGQAIWSIGPDDTVYEAIKLMEEKGVGALLVMQDTALVGIVSERDYARKVILKDRLSKQTRIEEIMTKNVYYTLPEQNLDACLAVMSEQHIRHLPVMQGEEVVGMISMGDVVKEIITQQQDKIEVLEHSLAWGESY